jgi:hypothetical protein
MITTAIAESFLSRFGVYIAVAVVAAVLAAAGVYHVTAVSRAYDEGAAHERDANRDASDRAKTKTRLSYELRAKITAGEMAKQKAVDDKMIALWQQHSVNLSEQLQKLTDAKDQCWSAEIVEGIWK